MTITAILPFATNKAMAANNMQAAKQNKNKNYSSLPMQNNNQLMDFNYGRALVKSNKTNKVSFGAAGTTTLSQKVSAAYKLLQKNEILLIGKDFEMAKAQLKNSIEEFDGIIKKIYFIENPYFSLALKKNGKDKGEAINIGFEQLYKRDSQGNTSSFAFHNNHLEMDASDSLHCNEGVISSLNVPVENEYEVEQLYIKPYDLSTSATKSLNKANLAQLKQLDPAVPLDKKGLTFADIAGQDDAIEQIKETVLRPLKNPNCYSKNKIGKNSKTLLFVGPPGTGKTLAAKALANEAGVNFIEMNGQALEGKYVGDSAKNIQKFYADARDKQPCIIFFDEIDGFLKQRTGEHAYLDQSVNMHLDEMSKLEKEGAKVYIIGATNHPEIMDEAATRSGRFGTKIMFKNPDTAKKCEAIFNIHTKDVELYHVNKSAVGRALLKAQVSGADIASIVDDAKMNALKRQGIFEQMDAGTFDDEADFTLKVNGRDMQNAINKFVENRNLMGNFKEKRIAEKTEITKENMIANKRAQDELQKETSNAEDKPKEKREIGFKFEKAS